MFLRDRFLTRAAALWCAVAVGTLVFSAAVAPMLFQSLPFDRAMAGRIAGRGFEASYAITLAAAIVACLVCWLFRARQGRANLSISMALFVASLLQLAWVAPAIAHKGAGWPWSFASLHAAGGLVHLVLALLALTLAWRLLADG